MKKRKNILEMKKYIIFAHQSPGGGIGRRAGLKHQFLPWSAGSTPAPGTPSAWRVFYNIIVMNVISQEKQRQYDKHYLEMAVIWSKNSYCKRRMVGALLVKDKMIISDGFNGTPEGFENECEDENNVTKTYVLHAEANAITKVAKSSNNSLGATLYVTTSPCIECSKLIIQAGIKRVVYLYQYHNTEGLSLLKRANIEVIKFSADEGI